MTNNTEAPDESSDVAPSDIDTFEPDYEGKCENCEQSPTVTGLRNGKVVYDSGMCGPCTFGTAAALDPAWWNSTED